MLDAKAKASYKHRSQAALHALNNAAHVAHALGASRQLRAAGEAWLEQRKVGAGTQAHAAGCGVPCACVLTDSASLPALPPHASQQGLVAEQQRAYMEAAWGPLLALLRQDAAQPVPPNLSSDRAARQATKDKWAAVNKSLGEAAVQQVSERHASEACTVCVTLRQPGVPACNGLTSGACSTPHHTAGLGHPRCCAARARAGGGHRRAGAAVRGFLEEVAHGGLHGCGGDEALYCCCIAPPMRILPALATLPSPPTHTDHHAKHERVSVPELQGLLGSLWEASELGGGGGTSMVGRSPSRSPGSATGAAGMVMRKLSSSSRSPNYNN